MKTHTYISYSLNVVIYRHEKQSNITNRLAKKMYSMQDQAARKKNTGVIYGLPQKTFKFRLWCWVSRSPTQELTLSVRKKR